MNGYLPVDIIFGQYGTPLQVNYGFADAPSNASLLEISTAIVASLSGTMLCNLPVGFSPLGVADFTTAHEKVGSGWFWVATSQSPPIVGGTPTSTDFILPAQSPSNSPVNYVVGAWGGNGLIQVRSLSAGARAVNAGPFVG